MACNLMFSENCSSTSGFKLAMANNLEKALREYRDLSSRHGDLKSKERVLSLISENLKQVKDLIIEKEKEFCQRDQKLRIPAGSGRISVKDSLRKRCFNLVDHLLHYKCIIECLSVDVLAMERNLLSDDEFLQLSLIFRETGQAIIQAIRINQQRNADFLCLHDEEAQSYLSEVEPKWHLEHQSRRKLISRMILDQNQLVADKITKNLEQQQKLLNERYQSINNLIRVSYNRFEEDNNSGNDENNNIVINKNQ